MSGMSSIRMPRTRALPDTATYNTTPSFDGETTRNTEREEIKKGKR